MFGLVDAVPEDGIGDEIRSNSRYVVPKNSDQGASNHLITNIRSITNEKFQRKKDGS